uniref:EF-hand domain-containing protein n=1 Tax=Romanomermis culicivorax TaxID=13658 RepID=A0A915JPC5_ROMCU
MALSPFLMKKFDYLFHQFYDSNKNGIITHSDFVDKIKGLQKFRHWPSNDDRLKTCKTTLNNAWNALKHTADANKDQKKIKKTEEKINEKKSSLAPKRGILFWLAPKRRRRTWGVEGAAPKRAFPLIDREQYRKLWLEYMTSEKEDSPGNFILGRTMW